MPFHTEPSVNEYAFACMQYTSSVNENTTVILLPREKVKHPERTEYFWASYHQEGCL